MARRKVSYGQRSKNCSRREGDAVWRFSALVPLPGSLERLLSDVPIYPIAVFEIVIHQRVDEV